MVEKQYQIHRDCQSQNITKRMGRDGASKLVMLELKGKGSECFENILKNLCLQNSPPANPTAHKVNVDANHIQSPKSVPY